MNLLKDVLNVNVQYEVDRRYSGWRLQTSVRGPGDEIRRDALDSNSKGCLNVSINFIKNSYDFQYSTILDGPTSHLLHLFSLCI